MYLDYLTLAGGLIVVAALAWVLITCFRAGCSD